MLRKRVAGFRFRHSDVVFTLIGAGLLSTALSCTNGVDHTPSGQTQALVRGLGLSDLTLFTEARYLRHLSQADLHSAFQDHPVSFDHFPGGSLVMPRLHAITEGLRP